MSWFWIVMILGVALIAAGSVFVAWNVFVERDSEPENE